MSKGVHWISMAEFKFMEDFYEQQTAEAIRNNDFIIKAIERATTSPDNYKQEPMDGIYAQIKSKT